MSEESVEITVLPEQLKPLDDKLDDFDIDQRFRYSVQQILQDLGIDRKVPELNPGQELTLIKTNVIVANKGTRTPDVRYEWRTSEDKKYLILYYSLYHALQSMTVNTIKDLLIENGTDFSQHENKEDYINLFIDVQVDVRESLGFW